MSTMAVKYILTPSCKVAVTAMLNHFSLHFFKHSTPIINCQGIYRISDLFPFFMFAHDLANAHFTQCIIANPPCIMRLNPQGRGQGLLFSPLFRGAYE